MYLAKRSFPKDIETCTSSHTLQVGFLLGERCQTQECRIFGNIESNVEINAQTAARPCLLVRPKCAHGKEDKECLSTI